MARQRQQQTACWSRLIHWGASAALSRLPMEPEAGLQMPSPIKGPSTGLPPRVDSVEAGIAARPSHRRMGSAPESVRWGFEIP